MGSETIVTRMGAETVVVVATAATGPAGSGGGGAVTSVNTQTGTVVLAAADVGADVAGAAAAAQAASQPLDSDLTAIAALSTTSYGRAFLALADAAAARTALALGTAATSNTGAFDASGAAAAAQAASQPLDADLTTLAGLTATTDNFIISVSSAWASRTPAQAKTTLALVKADVGLGNVDNTADASKAFSGAQITSGTVPVGQLPTGTGSSNVVLGGVITGAGPVGDAAHTPVLTYNAAGQLTTVTNTAIALAGSAITSGTVGIARLPTGTGSSNVLLGGVITAAGPQGDASHTQVITFNAAGQLTAATNTAIAIDASQVTTGLSGTYALLAGPAFTGGITVSGPVNAGGGFQGLDFVGTEDNNVACTVDLRSFGGTSGSRTPTPSGTVLGGMHIGGWPTTGGSTAVDCAQIYCRATQVFSSTQSGTAWDFYTTTNGTNVKSVALTLDNDGSATFRAGITLAGALAGVTTLTATSTVTLGSSGQMTVDASGNIVTTGALTTSGGYTLNHFATATTVALARTNGSSGSPSKVLSTQTLGQVVFQGYNDTDAGTATGASVSAVAEQDFTLTGIHGAGLRFSTAPTSGGATAVRLILDNAGKLWWGATTGAATAFVDQTGNASFNGTLLAGGNIGFNGKAAQATTGWSAATATALRTAAPNATYSTTGGTGATAGAFDTAAHRDNVITDLANTMRRLGTLIADLTANGVIG